MLSPPAAPALGVRDQRSHGGVGTGLGVSLGHTHPQGRAVGVAREVGEATRRNQRQVGSRPLRLGPLLAEGCDRHIDETRLDLAQLLVAESQLGHAAGPFRLDQEVGPRHQAQQHPAIRGVFEVEREAALVARVRTPEEGAFRAAFPIDPRADAARGRAAGRLDLDDIRTEVRQDLPAEQTVLVRQVQDAIRGQHATMLARSTRARDSPI